jgi:hypothetical protein
LYGWQDDDFNGGTFLWQWDASHQAAAGHSRVITDYVASTSTATWASAVPAGIADGDLYALILKRYPRNLIVAKINQALREWGEIIAYTDITSTGAQEYALADTYKRIAYIERGDLTATVQNWGFITSYRHSEGRLRLATTVPSGQTIRVHYYTPHCTLVGDGDILNVDVNLDWLALAAAQKIVRWRLAQVGSDDKALTAQLNDLMIRESQHRAKRRNFRARVATNIFPAIPDR